MQKQFKLPIIFLVIAGGIGLLLRWHFYSPLSWLKYPYWLHAHSHLMFLGWVVNTLLLAFLFNYDLSYKRYQKLLLSIQLLLVGMLISFPLQGYGVASIAFSTLHTFCIWIFTYLIFRDFKTLKPSISIWHAKVSLLLFGLSSIGPFVLGALVANGLGQSKWYYFAVYYYLHFQYNGVFIFGVLSLFYQLLEQRGITFDRHVKTAGVLLLLSLFPTYFLSTLWAKPDLIFNIIGFVGAILQLLFIILSLKTMFAASRLIVNKTARILMAMSGVFFILKAILQLLSAFPSIATLAFQVRPFIIAYLHLVVIGVVTLFLLAWYIERSLVKFHKSGLALFIIGFIGSECVMVESGIGGFSDVLNLPILLFIFSAVMWLALVSLMFNHKNQHLAA